jgi:hypothetical protein
VCWSIYCIQAGDAEASGNVQTVVKKIQQCARIFPHAFVVWNAKNGTRLSHLASLTQIMRLNKTFLLLLALLLLIQSVSALFRFKSLSGDNSTDDDDDEDGKCDEYRDGDLKGYDDTDDDDTRGDADEADRDAEDVLESKSGYKFTFAGKSGLVKIRTKYEPIPYLEIPRSSRL